MKVMTASWSDINFYTVAFTVRSGSNLLCDYLSANGMGLPSEYFQYPFGAVNKYWYDLLGVPKDEFMPFLDRLVNSMSPNRLFGAKLAWDHKNALVEEVRKYTDAVEDLDDLFPGNSWAYVCRNDKIGQAVSLWRAKKTNLWFVKADEDIHEPEYDFFEIFNCFSYIVTEDYLWKDYFDRKNIKPFIVVYEDFLKDPVSTVYGLHCHVRPEGALKIEEVKIASDLKVQRNMHSKKVKERFREDLYRIGESKHWQSRGDQLKSWLGFYQNYAEWKKLF
ncbi:MAG: hypothetical protein HY954_05155 [Deltaproteobacteria bacterium]|nr:hypothetical protein [Deltaproteobacteria bacterium]